MGPGKGAGEGGRGRGCLTVPGVPDDLCVSIKRFDIVHVGLPVLHIARVIGC